MGIEDIVLRRVRKKPIDPQTLIRELSNEHDSDEVRLAVVTLLDDGIITLDNSNQLASTKRRNAKCSR